MRGCGLVVEPLRLSVVCVAIGNDVLQNGIVSIVERGEGLRQAQLLSSVGNYLDLPSTVLHVTSQC